MKKNITTRLSTGISINRIQFTLRILLFHFAVPLVFFLSSCEDMITEIPWETENIPAKWVVEAQVTTENKYHYVYLSRSSNYFSSEGLQKVSDAEVSVSVNNKTYLYHEEINRPGVYVSDEMFAGIPGNTYQLKIEAEDTGGKTKTLEAQTTMHAGFNIDTAIAAMINNPVIFEEEDSTLLLINLLGTDNTGEENFYLLKMWHNEVALDTAINDFDIFSDRFSGVDVLEAISLSRTVNTEPDDLLTVELHRIPEDYFRFLEGVKQISQPSDPLGLAGPPADAMGNINHGEELGFFHAAYISRGETRVADYRDAE